MCVCVVRNERRSEGQDETRESWPGKIFSVNRYITECSTKVYTQFFFENFSNHSPKNFCVSEIVAVKSLQFHVK